MNPLALIALGLGAWFLVGLGVALLIGPFIGDHR